MVSITTSLRVEYFNKICTIATWPISQAMYNGVLMRKVLFDTFAPASTNNLAHPAFPFSQAMNKGVLPVLLEKEENEEKEEEEEEEEKREIRGQQKSHLLFLETPVATRAILCFFLFSKTFFVLQQNIPSTTVRVLLTWQNPNHISIGRSAEQMYVGHRRGGLHWNCRGGTAPATIR